MREADPMEEAEYDEDRELCSIDDCFEEATEFSITFVGSEQLCIPVCDHHWGLIEAWLSRVTECVKEKPGLFSHGALIEHSYDIESPSISEIELITADSVCLN